MNDHITARIATLRETGRAVNERLTEARQAVASLESQQIGVAHRINELESLLTPPEPAPEPALKPRNRAEPESESEPRNRVYTPATETK